MSSLQLPPSLAQAYVLKHAHDVRIAIVASLWNTEVMDRLLEGAIASLEASGLEQTEIGNPDWEGEYSDQDEADDTPVLSMSTGAGKTPTKNAEPEVEEPATITPKRGGISNAYEQLKQKTQLTVTTQLPEPQPTPVPPSEARAQMAALPRIIDIEDEIDETEGDDTGETAAGLFVVIRVPGAFELPLAAQYAMERHDLDAVITLGCIVRGGTPHFEYVCQATAAGVMQAGLNTGRPVVFGVLTTDDQQQALERSGGPHGHKGYEAASTALHMIDLLAD